MLVKYKSPTQQSRISKSFFTAVLRFLAQLARCFYFCNYKKEYC